RVSFLPPAPRSRRIREKSQFRAQDDSLSLSPRSMTAPSLYLTSDPWPPFPLGGLFFAPAFTRERMSAGHLPQSSSASRFPAGADGFFILSQSGERPERYIEPLRFDTIPSRPSLHAWAKTVGPSPSMCSLNRMPGRALPSRGHRPQALSLHGSIMISFPLGPGRNEFGPAVVRVRTAKTPVARESPPARTFRRLAECNCNERNRPY